MVDILVGGECGEKGNGERCSLANGMFRDADSSPDTDNKQSLCFGIKLLQWSEWITQMTEMIQWRRIFV